MVSRRYELRSGHLDLGRLDSIAPAGQKIRTQMSVWQTSKDGLQIKISFIYSMSLDMGSDTENGSEARVWLSS